ncbi:TIR domain-containing protein [Longimicrobium sp.]|jgi:class 3 adenylate cyclase|uniref:TIR domain-containing protein n=1 Tax=Longimicrobium sp. TaxID=2029185 RepID=UPI002F93E81E
MVTTPNPCGTDRTLLLHTPKSLKYLVKHLLNTAELATLAEVSRALTAEVNLPVLLDNILRHANELTDSAASSVILFNPERESLYFAHATGPSAEKLLFEWGKTSSQGVPIHGSIAGQVFSTGVPARTDAVWENPEHFKDIDAETNMKTASMLCVPLEVGSERIGVVQLLNKITGNYTDRDSALLDHFAAQAAIAIRNAKLFEDLLAHMGFTITSHPSTSPIEFLTELGKPARTETLSVLFADMRGFTQLCLLVTRPERTQELLNAFLSMLADSVTEFGGSVNKFLGDGILALFRGDEHAVRALRSASLIVTRFDRLRGEWNATTNFALSFLDVGIGIASDSAILGSVGSRTVRDFTAVGTTVNLAANLMEDARHGRQILIDKRTFLANQHQIASAEGPESFELKKPGQLVGHPYERYWVKEFASRSLVSTPADASPKNMTSNVFVSYSHHDSRWLKDLQTHLKPHARLGKISAWDDTMIRPGKRWRDEIERAIATAKIAVLLVSPNFLESNFIAENELPPLLEAAKTSGLTIIWVPLSASSFHVTPIAEYQSAIDPKRPLDQMSPPKQNGAWVTVCNAITAALSEQG